MGEIQYERAVQLTYLSMIEWWSTVTCSYCHTAVFSAVLDPSHGLQCRYKHNKQMCEISSSACDTMLKQTVKSLLNRHALNARYNHARNFVCLSVSPITGFATSKVNGKTKILTPCRSETQENYITKLDILITLWGTILTPNFIGIAEI